MNSCGVRGITMAKSSKDKLGKAVDVLVRELFKLRQGEIFVITADTESDESVVKATAKAAFSAGAKPVEIWVQAPDGIGKAADPMLPQSALVGALKGADAWVEFNNKWIYYSTTYDIVMQVVSNHEWIDGVISGGYYPPTSLIDKSTSIHGKPAEETFSAWSSYIRNEY